MSPTISRRSFMTATAVAGAAATTRSLGRAATPGGDAGPTVAVSGGDKPALLGGTPVRSTPFPSWPVVDEGEEKALLDVLHSGNWFRGSGQTVTRFEEAWAGLTGARHCLATANGTSAG